MARALMLMTSEHARDSLGQAQYTFHERLGGGVAGRVYRVADVHGRVLAAKRARQPSDNLSLLAEAQLQLAGGTHPNLLQLQDIALKCTQKMPQRVDVRLDQLIHHEPDRAALGKEAALLPRAEG